MPVDAVGDDLRLLGDLHLNSITVGQLVAEAARRLGLPPSVSPTRFADATVAEASRALAEQAVGGPPVSALDSDTFPAGIEGWVRPFSVEWVERPRPEPGLSPADGPAHWRLFAPDHHPLAGPLRAAFRGSFAGVIVALPPCPDERRLPLLLDAARAALDARPSGRFVLIQHGGGGAAFARSLHLEAPWVDTVVVDVPPGHPEAPAWVAAEARAGRGYAESRYDDQGRRFEPVLRHVALDGAGASPTVIGSGDVVLVTGGGKGIGAECALALARRTGVRLGLLGRSRPGDDAELAANLRRFEAEGVVCRYVRADVTVADEVREAVAEVSRTLGPVVAVLHSAGVNEPRALAELDEATLHRTLAPKVQGLRHVLAAVGPDRLKLLVTFGSVIARTGMRGEAHYALANAWLTDLTERVQAENPACRCLALEWSVWASVGMGERLGRVEALAREGVGPIPTDAGVDLFVRLVTNPPPGHTSLVVAGRLGDLPSLRIDRPPLPRLRFLERPRIDYPGVELVVEAELDADADPYLDDHVLQGERLFPAVLGLEAMSQAVAGVLRGREGDRASPTLRDVRFDRPVTVSAVEPTTIRLVALVRDSGSVEVALRCGSTGFLVDHFRATFHAEPVDLGAEGLDLAREGDAIAIDPTRDLYSGLLFQRGRFRRITGYRRLRATECLAELSPGDRGGWFARGAPEGLTLGDPAARDAAIHAVQACIPDAPLLPVGVDRIVSDSGWTAGPRRVVARERSFDDGVYVYDLIIYGNDGRPRERWDGLRLRAVGGAGFPGPWAGPLLGPHVERRVAALVPGSGVAVAVQWDAEPALTTEGRRAASDTTIRRLTGAGGEVHRRPDGKPEVGGGPAVSASHAGGLTLAVSAPAPGPVGCDAETVAARTPDVWRELLGPRRFALADRLTRETGDSLDLAATRVWAAAECLAKAGAADPDALVFETSGPDGWTVLRCGPLLVPTGRARVVGDDADTVFAVALPSRRGDPLPKRVYEYRHVVCFEETNFVGNVYFVNHLRWQGRCREMFLRDHAPAVLDDLSRDLALLTTRVACDYLAELKPMDALDVLMSLESMDAGAIHFRFEYRRAAEVVAVGEQTVACARRTPTGLERCPVPPALREALEPFL